MIQFTLENKEKLSFIIRILYTMIALLYDTILYVVLNHITKKILKKICKICSINILIIIEKIFL